MKRLLTITYCIKRIFQPCKFLLLLMGFIFAFFAGFSVSHSQMSSKSWYSSPAENIWERVSIDEDGGLYLAENARLSEMQEKFAKKNVYSVPGQYEGASIVFVHWGEHHDKILLLITQNMSEELYLDDQFKSYIESGILIPVEIPEISYGIWPRDYLPITLKNRINGSYKSVIVPSLKSFGNRRTSYPFETEYPFNMTDIDTQREAVVLESFYKAASLLTEKEIILERHDDFIFEGVNLLSDGFGNCFTDADSVKHNYGERQKKESKELFIERMKEIYGCESVIFLEVDSHDVQHIDMIITVAGRDKIILSMNSKAGLNDDYRKIRGLEKKNMETLLKAGYRVYRAPRHENSRTSANVLITESSVYVPQYPGHYYKSIGESMAYEREIMLSTKLEDLKKFNLKGLEVYTKLFKGKKIVPFTENFLDSKRGSIHCRTMELAF